MRRAWVAGVLLLLLALAGPAAASEQRPTLSELEPELVCPSCNTTLDMSNAPTAEQMRAFIRRRIAAGDTKSEIKDKLVAQLGPAVLAEPPKRGFDLLAWLVPLGGGLAAAAALGVAARRWTARRDGPPPATGAGMELDPELERRVDEALLRYE